MDTTNDSNVAASNVPALRFPGFEYGWLPVSLGEHGSTYGGLSGKTKSDFGHGDAKFIVFMNIISNTILDPNKVKCFSMSPDEKQNKVLEKDLLFNGSSETPEEIAFACAVESLNGATYLNSFCFGYRPLNHSKLNSIFLAYFFRSPIGRASVFTLAQGSTRYNISKKALLERKIYVPGLPEQQKIANFLTAIDKHIELLEKKVELLKQRKTWLLTNLLTVNPETNTPILRFPGFEGEWDSVLLGDVSEMRSGGTPKSTVKEYYGGSIPWVSIADMSKQGKYITGTKTTLTNAGVRVARLPNFNTGTVLYAMYASIGEVAIATLPVTTSQAILGISCKNKLVNSFLYYWLLYKKSYTKSLGQTGTQSNLNKAIVQNLKIQLPPIPEQQKIAEFLTAADKHIELLEEKMELLKQHKTWLLTNLLTIPSNAEFLKV